MTVVVFVHGLWLTGIESTLLLQRIGAELKCQTHYFHYPSVTASMADIVAELRSFLRRFDVETLHLVGHSLGGIVVLRLLETYGDLPAGRAVLLGSPLKGSRAAQGLARWPIGAAILGRNIESEVLTPPSRRWQGQRELGIIAGDVSLGLGRFFGVGDEPNDGTVCVSETMLEGVTDHIVVRISHTGMLFSGAVAHQTAQFLANGRFLHQPSSDP
jgi:pimeloyl-ACP methyl ester carboxylesterase